MEELMLFCASILGSCSILLKVVFTSKCKSICWGMCVRDVDAVIKEEKLQMTGHAGDTPRKLELQEPEPEK